MNRILVVTGLGRCGSSAMMQALVVGGVPVFADHLVSFETEMMTKLPYENAWLEQCRGKALKVLDPLHYGLPRGYAYDFILMTRSPRQQTLSTAKFMRAMSGIAVDRKGQLKLEHSIVRDVPRIRQMLSLYSDSTLTEVTFEDLLLQPAKTLARVESQLCPAGWPFYSEKAAAAILQRSPKNYPGVMEFSPILQSLWQGGARFG